jgi:hypothetical protein
MAARAARSPFRFESLKSPERFFDDMRDDASSAGS